jgi:D-inositol-3-phosphate glycosyltransferase
VPPERVVVWIPTRDHGWELEPAHPHEPRWIGGGLRTLHELAVAIAAIGRGVEMRGVVHPPTLEELSDAAGARPDLPDHPRPLTSADTVIVPEGIDDPAIHARLALSPARVIVMLLGPPGLVGWPFTPGWAPQDPLTVEMDAVARPEHFQGAAALGHELWTHSPALQAAAERAGVGCRFIGNGRPGAFPDPPAAKDIDLVTLRDNRWAQLADPVGRQLAERGVDWLALPQSGNERVLEAFGRARILLHPCRVEGYSRIGCEARAMGAVPVVLDSNVYAVGLDAAGGAVAVGTPAEMADAVTSLLEDRARLAGLADTAMATARRQVEWEPYLRRVDTALSAPAEDAGRGARAALGVALREAEAPVPRAHVEPPREQPAAERRQLERSLAVLNDALTEDRARLERHKLWLDAVNDSISWRLTAPLRRGRSGSLLASGLEAASRALDRHRRETTGATLASNGDWPPPGFFAEPCGRVDRPSPEELVARAPVRLLGWCLFPGSATARVDVVVGGGAAAQARLATERPDVAELTDHPGAPSCGFELLVDLGQVAAEAGTVTIETVAHAVDGRRLRLDPLTLTLAGAPTMNGAGEHGLRLRKRQLGRSNGNPRRPVRVLAFSHQLGIGGASLYLCELIERLTETREFEFHVVSPEDGPLRDELEIAGTPVQLTNGAALETVVRYEGNQAELGAWAAARGFDVALVNTLGSFPGADLAARLGIPAIWSIHESFDPDHFWAAAYPPGTPPAYVRGRAEEALARAEALVFPAEATARLFARHAAPDRLITLPYGIELPAIDAARRLGDPGEARRRLGIDADATVILCLGTIEPRKSQTMLVQAFEQIADRHASATLLLVGKTGPGWSAPYVAGLEDHLRRSPLAERVRVEPISDDPYLFHSIADLHVCASDLESLPRSIVEAMAFETPVLSTDVFGVGELIEDRRTGFLCPPRDAAALARALDRVLSADPAELRSVARAGARLVRERHDPARQAARMADLLRGVRPDQVAPRPSLSPAHG